MLLSSLFQLEQSNLTFNPLSVATSSPITETDDEALLTMDPELAIQKRLIEVLFEPDEEKEKPSPFAGKDEDSVSISLEALELYEREYGNLIFENGEERLEIQYERVEYLRIESSETALEEAEPLVLDLNGNGIELTDIRKGQGVAFDITGDGVKEKVSWVSPDDGMLVYDRNGNGTIDSGKELFGDQHGAVNGFEELAKFDNDSSGAIDKKDDIYTKLHVWQDLNQNGYSEANELKSIEEYGIESIDLHKDNTHTRIAGNRVEGYSTYQTAKTKGKIAEVFFNYLV